MFPIPSAGCPASWAMRASICAPMSTCACWAAGMVRVSEYAALNANYLMKRLTDLGYEAAYPARRASHEFIITLKSESRRFEVTAMDVAKRLLDFGCMRHDLFPAAGSRMSVDRATETETKEELDIFAARCRRFAGKWNKSPRNCEPDRIQCRCGGSTT